MNIARIEAYFDAMEASSFDACSQPTCFMLEDNYKKVFYQSTYLPNGGFLSSGSLVAEYRRLPVLETARWMDMADGQERVVLIKNPQQSFTAFFPFGIRNALLYLVPYLFAAKVHLGDVEITRPIRRTYQDELRKPFLETSGHYQSLFTCV